MLELSSSGSVRGVPSNGHPYRDPGPTAVTRAVPMASCAVVPLRTYGDG